MKRIIFLHGGPGFTDYLKPYFGNQFEDHHCVFYDQKQSESLTVDDLVGQLDEIIETQREPSETVLLGHSWGGVLATVYAQRHPNKIKGLILMSTGLNSTQWSLYNKELDDASKADISREELFFTSSEMNAGKAMFELECWEGFSEESFDAIHDSYLAEYDLLKSLENLKMPILNVFGENDLRFSKNVTTTFKTYNKDILDLEIKDAGHFPYLLPDNRAIIVANIKEFLSK
ncbi:alpha/beta hydrolase [bacterium]|nr:alpha/beta hydrolase [bacterium]